MLAHLLMEIRAAPFLNKLFQNLRPLHHGSLSLPDLFALMGASDVRQPQPSSSLLTLVRGCASSAPTVGSPWLPHSLDVKLGAA